MDKILIIDDDKPICVTLAYALEDLYSVKWTQDGAAGAVSYTHLDVYKRQP